VPVFTVLKGCAMSDINDLLTRIDGAIATVKEKVGQNLREQLQEYAEGQKRLEPYEKAQARVVEVARPRLEALAARVGERLAVTPSVCQTRRAVKFDFQSPQACITLTFSVAPDRQLKNVVVEYDLDILPVLMQYESHAEFTSPIDALDTAGLAKWLDDRIVGFVELFIGLYDHTVYATGEYVTDPVVQVRFPKFAAAATLEHDGQKYFFIDERTRQDFVRQKGITPP
jgi:hypothetical protein